MLIGEKRAAPGAELRFTGGNIRLFQGDNRGAAAVAQAAVSQPLAAKNTMAYDYTPPTL